MLMIVIVSAWSDLNLISTTSPAVRSSRSVIVKDPDVLLDPNDLVVVVSVSSTPFIKIAAVISELFTLDCIANEPTN